MSKIAIGVIAPYLKQYLHYIECMPEDKNIDYHWIHSINSTRGKVFTEYVTLRGYDELPDLSDILHYLDTHKPKDVLFKGCLTEGEFTVDRKTLVFWAKPILEGVVARRMIRDLVMGSEFVITTQDLLDACTVLPANLVNEFIPKGVRTISTDIITITYKQPEDEILPTTITK